MIYGGNGTETRQLEFVAGGIDGVVPPRDTATVAVQPAAGPTETANSANWARECRFFGTTITANALAPIAVFLTAMSMFWTIASSFLSQRWTVRNDTLQDCLNFRQVEIALDACNRTLEQGIPSFWRKRSLFEPAANRPFGASILLGICLFICLLALALGCCKRRKMLKFDVESATQHQDNLLELADLDTPSVDEQFIMDDPEPKFLPAVARVKPPTSALRRRKGVQYECLDCPASFTRRVDIVRHQQITHGLIDYLCAICSHKAHSRDKMRKHCRVQHGQVIGQETYEKVKPQA